MTNKLKTISIILVSLLIAIGLLWLTSRMGWLSFLNKKQGEFKKEVVTSESEKEKIPVPGEIEKKSDLLKPPPLLTEKESSPKPGELSTETDMFGNPAYDMFSGEENSQVSLPETKEEVPIEGGTTKISSQKDSTDKETLGTPPHFEKESQSEKVSSESLENQETKESASAPLSETKEESLETKKTSETNTPVPGAELLGFIDFTKTELKRDEKTGLLIEEKINPIALDPNRKGISLGETLDNMSLADRQALVQRFSSMGVLDALGSLPSATMGFTSDPDMAYIDGLPNPSYALVLKEDLELFIAFSLDQKFNPSGAYFIGSDFFKNKEIGVQVSYFEINSEGNGQTASYKVRFEVVFSRDEAYEKLGHIFTIIADKEGGMKWTEKQS